jgi:helicase
MSFYGLFIGVDKHISPLISQLTCAARDATVLEALFADNIEGQTKLLVDGAATRDGIKSCFDDLAQCTSEDTVVISFSGHGSESHELITHDAQPSRLQDSAIPMDELVEWLSVIPAKQIVLLMDCCFSGGLGAKVFKVDTKPRDMSSIEGHLSKIAGEGRIILTASGASEPAWENQKYGHGYFTYALLQALRGPDEVVEGGKVNIYKLIDFVTKSVKASAAAFGEQQNPSLRGSIDKTLTWPIFVNGDRFHLAFPEQKALKVTGELRELNNFGISDTAITSLSQNIPSLNQLQIDAVNDYGLLTDHHVVVSAPTSSGKTMIGELAALRAVGQKKKAIFLFPLKALVADKLQYFEKVYGSSEIKTIEATGETDDLSDLLRGRYDVALLTYEKFASIALSFPHVLRQAGVIVIDESQTLADEARGANLEFLMTLIRMKRRGGIEPQIVSLSAVIGDMNGFESWLGGRLLKREKRPVPLDEGLLLADGSFRFLEGVGKEEETEHNFIQPHYSGKNSSQDLIIPLVKKLVNEGKQVIVFRETKGETRGCAKYLARDLALPSAKATIERLPDGDPSKASDELRIALEGGVCFHNADLDRHERLVLEEEFRKPDSEVRVIVATTTLAMGVNTPAAAVVVCGLTHPGNKPYTVAEYKNLVGRAGRLGFSEKGSSFLIAQTHNDAHNFWQAYVTGTPEDLFSRFLDSSTDPRSMIVRVIAASEALSTDGIKLDELIAFLGASFGAFLIERADPNWSWNKDDLRQSIGDLLNHELVAETETGGYVLTDLGRVAGEAGIEVGSIVRLVGTLKGMPPEHLDDPTLLAVCQVTLEMDQQYFPMNKRGYRKEFESWVGILRQQSVSPGILAQLRRGITEEFEEALRAKKVVACLAYIAGKEIADIEDLMTRHGGAFNGAAGPIRATAMRTCDVLAPTARVAEILYPELDLHERVEKLLIRLTYGIESCMVDLARQVGNLLTRADYTRLSQRGLCAADEIDSASDIDILSTLEGSSEKLALLREKTAAMRQFADEESSSTLFLEPYKQ